MSFLAAPPASLELGLGLLSIGRAWGVGQSAPPSDDEAARLLDTALRSGIRVFDTAPAYAASEARLGAFLAGLPRERRDTLRVLTKAGEHWDVEAGTGFVDHSRDALCRSIDRSLALLGRIDLLQIHKATAAVVRDPQVHAALDHAAACGIPAFGASVSSVEAGLAALETGRFRALQFPFNRADRTLEPLIPALRAAGATAIVNRPFAMGALVASGNPSAAHGPPAADDPLAAGRAAFAFVEERIGAGIVLTGTGKAAHLVANVEAFRGRRSA